MAAEPRSYFIDGDAGKLVVHDWGGAGPATLLSHPTGFHGRVWAPVAERLAAAGRHVWSFDFRGHGDSDAPEPSGDTYTWSAFAADALTVVDHLGLAGDPALVACGHSKGATALVLGEALRPGAYARIWAYEPVLFPDDRSLPSAENFPLASNARRRRNEWRSVDEAYDAYASKPPLGAMAPEALRAYVDYGLRDRGDGVFELKCRPEVESSVYAMAPVNGAWAVLPQLQLPVLVASGEESNDIGPALAQRITQRLPHGRFEAWAGCRHFGPFEDPAKCAASVLDFVDS